MPEIVRGALFTRSYLIFATILKCYCLHIPLTKQQRFREVRKGAQGTELSKAELGFTVYGNRGGKDPQALSCFPA